MPKSVTRSDSIYNLRNPDGDPFSYRPEIDRELEIIGLVLWAAEGDKTQLSLANGNPYVVSKYLEFLRTICNFREEKIRAVIHCHNSVPYGQCVAYWSKVTRIPPQRFRKPYIKEDRGGKRRFPYGIVRIVATNRNLLSLFKEHLAELGLPKD